MNHTLLVDGFAVDYSFNDPAMLFENNGSLITQGLANPSIAVVGIFTSGLSIACNAAIVCVIYVTFSLNGKFHHTLVLNAAIADLALNILVCPLTIYDDFLGYWQLGFHVCKYWTMSQYVLLQVISICILLITANQALSASNPDLHYRIVNKIGRTSVFCLPWVVSALTVTPMLLLGAQNSEITKEVVSRGLCVVMMSANIALGLNCSIYFVPAFLILVLSVVTILRYGSWDLNDTPRSSFRSEQNDKINGTLSINPLVVSPVATNQTSPRHSPSQWSSSARKRAWGVGFAGTLFVAMWFPSYLLDTIMIICQFHCSLLISVNTLKVFHWIGIGTGVVRSAIFLHSSAVRRGKTRLSQETVREFPLSEDPNVGLQESNNRQLSLDIPPDLN